MVFHFIVIVCMQKSQLVELRIAKSVLTSNELTICKIIDDKAYSFAKSLVQLILIKRFG